MTNLFSRSFLLLAAVFYMPTVFAQAPDMDDVQIEMNANIPEYDNTGTITTADGYGIWLNGITGFDATIINTGNVLVTGAGYGIYETPYQTRPVKATVANQGLIQRIQLEETDGSIIQNGSQIFAKNKAKEIELEEEAYKIWIMTNPDAKNSPVITEDMIEDGVIVPDSSDAKIQGSVLLGVNAKIHNTNGTFENFDLDTADYEKGNLISLGRDSEIINGNVLMTRIPIDPTYIDPTISAEDLATIDQTVNIYRPIFTTAQITTDHIQFSENGKIENSSTISNKSVIFGNNGSLSNAGMPYLLENPGEELITDATLFRTDELSFGNNGTIKNEMGTTFKVGSLTMGNNATLTGGADYTYTGECTEDNPYCEILQIKLHKDRNDKPQQLTSQTNAQAFDDTVYYQYNTVPHLSVMDIEHAQLGKNSTIDFLNGQVKYTGKTLKVGDSSVFNMNGAKVILSDEEDGSLLQMGANSQLNLSKVEWHVTVPELFLASEEKDMDATLGDIKDILTGGTGSGAVDTTAATVIDVRDKLIYSDEIDAELTVDNLIMGSGSTITNDGVIKTQKIWMNDNSTINTTKSLYAGDFIFFGDHGTLYQRGEEIKNSELTKQSETRTTTLVFKDYGTIDLASGLLIAQDIWFGNYGTVTIPYSAPATNTQQFGSGQIIADTLTMGNNATIETSGFLTPFITVGSDSIATIFGEGTARENETIYDVLNKEDFITTGGLIGGFTKAPGAENVKIISDVPIIGTAADGTSFYTHGWLAGGVYADNILIQQGELWAQDDIYSNIDINTDSSLRVVGSNARFHGPISKLENATNTKLIVDLTGSDNFYETSNTVNVDHILLLGGGFTIQNPVKADEITLGSDTTVRLRGNYYTGDMAEWKGEAVNTTLAIDAGAGNTIYSTGKIKLDRVVVESGIFDINHPVEMTYRADNAIMPGANEQGLELSTDTVVNFNVDKAKVNRIVRDQLAIAKGAEITNTTVNVNGSDLKVERNVDVDRFNINAGSVEFMNEDTNNVVNIGNNMTVKKDARLAGDGVINIKSGSIDIDYGGRLSVSSKTISEKPVGTMKVIQNEESFFKTEDITSTGNATVNMAAGSILDLRADGGNADKIDVSGTVNFADGTRVIVRNIQAGETYELLSATQLNGNIDKLAASFLWTDKEFQNAGNTLMLKIGGVQTLNEGIASTQYSKNVWDIANALSAINARTASNTVDPFLDNVFYALTAEEAVQTMNDYSPEGYLNTYQGALRTMRTFRQAASAELDAMRTYRDVENPYTATKSRFNPNYFGRPGYEQYYANWSNRRGEQQRATRTDKGGLWAKPFAISATQDAKNNMTGYDMNTYGLTAGIDKRFGSLTLGLAGLYADGTLKQADKSVDTKTSAYGLGVYGNYRPYKTRKFFDFYALWGKTKNKSTRKINSLIESAKADYNIKSYSVGADMGYDMPIGRNIILTPKIGIDYTNLKGDKIQEKGTTRALLQVTPDRMTSIQTPIEVRAAFNYVNGMNKFKPEVHARWTHEFGDTSVKAKSLFVNYNQPFVTQGLDSDKDMFTLGGSLLWLYNVSELELRYDYDFSSSSTGHALNVGYKYLF